MIIDPPFADDFDEDDGPSETEPRGNRRLPPPPVTAERLEQAALGYLARFAASSTRLRRVLMRRVDRSVRDHGSARAEAVAWVEALIERYRRCGLLNDAAYAEAKASSLRRGGASARVVRGRLAADGLDATLAETALRQADRESDRQSNRETDGDDDARGGSVSAELAAALAWARRRRIGRYRKPDQRAAMRLRDLAALGRAGFDFTIAREVVDGHDQPEDA